MREAVSTSEAQRWIGNCFGRADNLHGANLIMADSEFEEFRQYFDQLPQHIKAPAKCYT